MLVPQVRPLDLDPSSLERIERGRRGRVTIRRASRVTTLSLRLCAAGRARATSRHLLIGGRRVVRRGLFLFVVQNSRVMPPARRMPQALRLPQGAVPQRSRGHQH
jgi:hypothetical protein